MAEQYGRGSLWNAWKVQMVSLPSEHFRVEALLIPWCVCIRLNVNVPTSDVLVLWRPSQVAHFCKLHWHPAFGVEQHVWADMDFQPQHAQNIQKLDMEIQT